MILEEPCDTLGQGHYGGKDSRQQGHEEPDVRPLQHLDEPTTQQRGDKVAVDTGYGGYQLVIDAGDQRHRAARHAGYDIRRAHGDPPREQACGAATHQLEPSLL